MQQRYFITPFGTSGDLQSVPTALDPTGLVSYTQGWTFDYERPTDGTDSLSKDVIRQNMNSMFFDVTTVLQDWQQYGTPESISSTDNGGTAFPYGKGAIVRTGSGSTWTPFVSLVGSNTAAIVEGANWSALASKADLTAILLGRLVGVWVSSTTQAGLAAVTVNIPANAKQAIIIATAGGGAGETCYTVTNPGGNQYFSAGGGGAGGTIGILLPVTGNTTLSAKLGAGGVAQSGPTTDPGSQINGGPSIVTYGGCTITAGGGKNALWNNPTSCSGGAGGVNTTTGLPTGGSILFDSCNSSATATSYQVRPWTQNAGNGSDGTQGGTQGQFIFAGNGAASYWGQGGRAASKGGLAAGAYGAGGGGSYSVDIDNIAYSGGQGGHGHILIYFLG